MPQVLREWGLRLLGASSEEIIPGAVLNPDRGFQREWYLRHALDGSTEEWPTKLCDGVIANVDWERSLGGKASLRIPGIVTIGGGLQRAQKGSFHINEVKTRIFTLPELDDIPLQLRVRDWHSDPANLPKWRKLRGKWFVESTWYATDYLLELKGASGADIQAEVAGDITVGLGADVEWVNARTIRVTGNTSVPFAIRYWPLR